MKNPIADPQLEIFDGNQRSVLANNDWSSADSETTAGSGAATGEALVEIYEVP